MRKVHSEAEIAEKMALARTLRAQGKGFNAIVRALGVAPATYARWMQRAPVTNGAASVTAENAALAALILRARGILPAH